MTSSVDAFDLGDQIWEDVIEATGRAGSEDNDVDKTSARLDTLEDLYRQASQLVYEGINVSIILATIVLFNMAVIHGVTNEYLNELLKYLGTVLLS
jgi:hypothetical protein